MISTQAIFQQIKDGPGHWRSCTGCYETNEGYPTAPTDPVFQCALGMGCHECGGLGAVWDSTDYEDMAAFVIEEDRKQAAMAEALRLLAAEDARQSKLHDILEDIREQIRLGVPAERRPEGLFKNIQDAVYAMRGRTALMNDAAITAAFSSSHSRGGGS